MTRHSHISVVFYIFCSNVITAFHDTLSIVLAKAFNSAVSKSIKSDFACNEFLAHADFKNLMTQSFFCFATSIIVVQIWINSTISSRGELAHSIKSMSGELVAWSFQEMTATILGLLSSVMQKNNSNPERSLGDAEFNEGEEWVFVASYGVYFGILSGIVLIVFGFALHSIFEGTFWDLSNSFYRSPCSATRQLPPDNSGDEEDLASVEVRYNQPFTRETSNLLAFEFTSDCIRLSYAWCANGYVSGMLVAMFTSSDGETDEIMVKSFGLLEVYCILTAAIGGLICGNASRFREKSGVKLTNLGEFCMQWWATWAGLAIASLASSPGAISSRLESSFENEHLFDLVRTLLSSLFAILLLFHASNVRVRRKIICIPISYHIGIEYGKILSTAAVFGFAVAWEEFGKDFACHFAEIEGEADNGISAIGAVWLYFAIILFTFFPLSILIGKRRKSIVQNAEKKLEAFLEDAGLRLEEEL